MKVGDKIKATMIYDGVAVTYVDDKFVRANKPNGDRVTFTRESGWDFEVTEEYDPYPVGTVIRYQGLTYVRCTERWSGLYRSGLSFVPATGEPEELVERGYNPEVLRP